MAEDRATRFDDEIAEIENRRGTRTLFMVVGGILGVVLLAIVFIGGRERLRLREIASRPQTEELNLGSFVGSVANTAFYSRGDSLYYVEGIGDAEFGDDTRFVRRIEYDQLGNPDSIPPGASHWTLASSDSLPYVLERVTNPLTGVTPTEFRSLELGSLRPDDYGAGGPEDWRPMEQEETRVQVSGNAQRRDDAVHLVADSVQIRLQGIEGLSAIDSLEVAWATDTRAPLTAFGRISSTPARRSLEGPLFVMTVTAVEPAVVSVADDTTAAAGTSPDTTGGASDTTAGATDTTGS